MSFSGRDASVGAAMSGKMAKVEAAAATKAVNTATALTGLPMLSDATQTTFSTFRFIFILNIFSLLSPSERRKKSHFCGFFEDPRNRKCEKKVLKRRETFFSFVLKEAYLIDEKEQSRQLFSREKALRR
jgi:hypothetical protein